MIWRTALCYIQLWLVLALASGQLTDEQKAQIVDLHNQYRSMVIPSASNIQRMVSTEGTCTNMSTDGMFYGLVCGGFLSKMVSSRLTV